MQDYAWEIFDTLAAEGINVHHFLLHADEDELVRRINEDVALREARDWRLQRLADYRSALPWIRESAVVIDTTHMTPAAVASDIARCVDSSS